MSSRRRLIAIVRRRVDWQTTDLFAEAPPGRQSAKMRSASTLAAGGNRGAMPYQFAGAIRELNRRNCLVRLNFVAGLHGSTHAVMLRRSEYCNMAGFIAGTHAAGWAGAARPVPTVCKAKARDCAT